MLTAAAAIAVALALVGLLLATVAQLRDERGELLDLESQGAGPKQLRRQLRLRAAIVLAFGLTGAALTGAALSVFVVRLVALTAGATRPEPPLVLALDWPVVAAAVALAGIGALALGAAVTARAFGDREAGRASEAAT